MHRLRATLAALLVGLLAASPAAAAGFSGSDSQTKKTGGASSGTSVLSQVGSATTGFFKGVKDKLTPKSATAKTNTKSTKSTKSTKTKSTLGNKTASRKPTSTTSGPLSWFSGNGSKSTK